MRPVFTPEQSRAFDRYLIEEVGMNSLVLMENAARAVMSEVLAMLPEGKSRSVLIFCGTGNNGGDGLALARMLLGQGVNVLVELVGDPRRFSTDAEVQYKILQKVAPNCLRAFDSKRPLESRCNLIVDALLGTGATGELRGPVADAVRAISTYRNECGVPTIAVDVPTGLDALNGCDSADGIVHADVTVTMGATKRGFYCGAAAEVTGRIVVANLGWTADHRKGSNRCYLIQPCDVREFIPSFSIGGSKFERGFVLTLSGSRGLTGAAVMSGEAALKVGCGLVRVATPSSERALVAQAMPELMTLELEESPSGSSSVTAFPTLQAHAERADALLIGPGLRAEQGTSELLLRVISEVNKPMVIDAGGLRALKGNAALLTARTAPTILTPHVGEMADLVGLDSCEVESNRYEIASDFASQYRCVVVMKGAPTYVFDTDGSGYINTTGNPGLGTAGSGDVLAGMIAGLLPRMQNHPANAALSAVYLHGLAGDIAAKSLTAMSMTARDITRNIPTAFQEIGIH